MVDLTTPLIKNLNAQSKTIIEVYKLLNKDCNFVEISKKEKKNLQKGLAPYVKAVKTSSKCRASFFNQIKQT